MKRPARIIVGLLLATGLFPLAARAGQEGGSPWTWVHGQLDDAADNDTYLTFARCMFSDYQSQGFMRGELIAEATLADRPEGPVVFIGPLVAFAHPEWFGLPMRIVAAGQVEIAGRLLTSSRTGIYLRDREETRVLYGGLSLDGFRDIFSVPTGGRPCTVTRGRGSIELQGKVAGETLALEEVPFLEPYPGPEDLRDLELPEGAIRVEPVWADEGELSPDFLSWLEAFVEEQRVLFVGESHWSVGVNRLFNRMVEDLLEYPGIRAIFLELNYSFTGFYDHYVHLADEEAAARFLRETLHPLVNSPATLELLVTLRRWNADHQEDPVSIACLDMEWGTSMVIDRIVAPFLRKVDPGFMLADPYTLKQAGKELPRAAVAKLLDSARRQEIIGPYPFLTPDYIENVVTNIWDTVSINDFFVDRQRSLIRNITDFNGALFDDGLVVFKGGGWHAVKHRPQNETYYRDAAYLDEVHPPTRGKVVTLTLNGLGYSFADVAGIDPHRYMPSATNYNNFVRDFQANLARKKVSADGYYLLETGGLNIFDSLMAKLGWRLGEDVLRVDRVDWDALARIHGQAVLQNRARDYDAIVYLLRSRLERTRSIRYGLGNE